MMQFSPREKQVLALLGECYTPAEIAVKLGRTHRTVHGHIYNIYCKTGIRNLLHLTRYAIEHGYSALFTTKGRNDV